MPFSLSATAAVLTLLFAAHAHAWNDYRAVPGYQADNAWYLDGVKNVKRKSFDFNVRARNIILFVGDGMGVSTVTAARILDGQNKGGLGEENELSFDRFPATGLSRTYNTDYQTPDSAGTMSAMMTGVKTDRGTFGVDEDVRRGECTSSYGNELVTALELAEIAGMSTGIISTARITHATPAATYAKSAERGWEDNADMPRKAVEDGCLDIASQLVDFENLLKLRYPTAGNIDGIEVMLGGGRRHFLPKDAAINVEKDPADGPEGDRTDGRNLLKEWQAAYADGVLVHDKAGFDKVDTESTGRLFGLFNESHMQYEGDRHNDILGEPSLTEMTRKAIDILDNNSEGYFLMVESGRIDHAHHAGNAWGALTDTIELSNAVQAAVDAVDMAETLIIVTADHSHVFTIAGYPRRGNPILGKVVNADGDIVPAGDGLPYTTLGYMNGRGHVQGVADDETDADESYDQAVNAGRADLSDVDTGASGFHQEALVPLRAETHGGEDVAIYAHGPGAQLVSGTNEQSVIFHVMNYVGRLEDKANRALQRGGGWRDDVRGAYPSRNRAQRNSGSLPPPGP